MTASVRVRVSGPLACFSRPDMKVERCSYEVMTPSAARGVLDAILWRPEMRWVIRRIEVLKAIRFIAFRRNEIQSKIAPRNVGQWIERPETYKPQAAGAGSDDATPRNTLALRDVAYVIEAEPLVFSPTTENTPTKYVAMLNRRAEKGQCCHRPCLGCREFAADFCLPNADDRPEAIDQDLGMMLYDIVFREDGRANKPVFFHAQLRGGILDARPEAAIPDADLRREVLACSYKRS